MWYQIIPSFAIMTAFLIIPGVTTTFVHKVTNGQKEKKTVRMKYQWYLMDRDARLSGKGQHFKSKGLENIH